MSRQERNGPVELDPRIEQLIQRAPKAEIHLHLVGSAQPDTIVELAKKYPDAGVPADAAEVRRWYEFVDFLHFIDVYIAVSRLVRSGEDIAALVEGSARDLAAQNVRYAEMTITPFTQLRAGIAYPEIVEGLDEGRARARRLGVDFAWVYDMPGEDGQEAAEATVALLDLPAPNGLVGFGLGGPEVGVDRRSYAWAFDRARAIGLHSVPHAGEADGPASVRAALDALGADRIGHGVRSVEDPELLRRLVDDQVPLEVCPSSNVCTGVYPTLADHSLPTLLAAGAFVSINTDDPPMFSTTLNDEYRRIATAFDLDVATIAQLMRNGVTASFMHESAKRDMLGQIDATVQAITPSI